MSKLYKKYLLSFFVGLSLLSAPRASSMEGKDQIYSNSNILNQDDIYNLAKNLDELDLSSSPRTTSLSPSSPSSSSTPFGINTPEKYVAKLSQKNILDIFIFNFCKFEKKSPENSLYPLINFLFEVRENQVQSKKIVLSVSFLEKLSQKLDESFFINLNKKILLCIKENNKAYKYKQSEHKKKQIKFKEDAQAIFDFYYSASNFLKKMKILENKDTLNIFQQHQKDNVDKFFIIANQCRKYYEGKTFSLKEFNTCRNPKEQEAYLVTGSRLIQKAYTELDAIIKSLQHEFVVHDEIKKYLENIFSEQSLKEEEQAFLQQLGDCLESILTYELCKEPHWELCPYLLAYFCEKNDVLGSFKKSKILSKNIENFKSEGSKKSLLSLFDCDNHTVPSLLGTHDNSDFCLSMTSNNKNSVDDKKSHHSNKGHCYFQQLLSTDSKNTHNTKIIELISNTPLYYLLCFNMAAQDAQDIITNIITNRHKKADIAKSCDSFEVVIDRLIVTYEKEKNTEIEATLRNVYDKIIKNLNKIKLEETESLYSLIYKPLICGAFKIASLFNLNDDNLKACVFVDIDHIESISFAINKDKFTGGHLDLSGDEVSEYIPAEFKLLEKCELGINPFNGIKKVDWFLAKKHEKTCCGHKLSTIFPSCIRGKVLFKYIESMYKASIKKSEMFSTITSFTITKPKMTTSEVTSNEEGDDDETAFKNEIFMCEHNHTDSCKDITCKYSDLVRVMFPISYNYIDANKPKKLENTVPIIKTFFPYSMFYFKRDENGNIYIDDKVITEEYELQEIIKNVRCYQRNGQSIRYDETGRPLYKDLTLTLETLKTIDMNDTDYVEIERDNHTKQLLIVTDGVCIEIFKKK